MCMLIQYFGFMGTFFFFYCLVGCMNMIVWTPAVWVSYMNVFCIFVFEPVQFNWACFTWKGALEIHSLLLYVCACMCMQSKPTCKYGAGCYQKAQTHLNKFCHPPKSPGKASASPSPVKTSSSPKPSPGHSLSSSDKVSCDCDVVVGVCACVCVWSGGGGGGGVLFILLLLQYCNFQTSRCFTHVLRILSQK